MWWIKLQQNIQKIWKNSCELRCIFILWSLMWSTPKKHIDTKQKKQTKPSSTNTKFRSKKANWLFFSVKKGPKKTSGASSLCLRLRFVAIVLRWETHNNCGNSQPGLLTRYFYTLRKFSRFCIFVFFCFFVLVKAIST